MKRMIYCVIVGCALLCCACTNTKVSEQVNNDEPFLVAESVPENDYYKPGELAVIEESTEDTTEASEEIEEPVIEAEESGEFEDYATYKMTPGTYRIWADTTGGVAIYKDGKLIDHIILNKDNNESTIVIEDNESVTGMNGTHYELVKG